MGQPWGLSGPEFLWLYAVGFLVSLGVVRVGSRDSGTDGHVDHYQVAYVAGGAARVLDTAIARLALRDQILVARRGMLTAVHGAIVQEPIEAAVYRVLNPSAYRSVVLRRLRDDPAIAMVGDRVRSQGLLLGRGRVLLWRLAVLVPIGAWVVGVIRVVNGAHLHRTIGYLTILLVLSVFVLFFLVLVRLRTRWPPSAAGRAVLRRLRREYDAQHLSAEVDDATLD